MITLTMAIYLLGGSEFFGRPYMEFIYVSLNQLFTTSNYHVQTFSSHSPLTSTLVLFAGLIVGFSLILMTFKWVKANK